MRSSRTISTNNLKFKTLRIKIGVYNCVGFCLGHIHKSFVSTYSLHLNPSVSVQFSQFCNGVNTRAVIRTDCALSMFRSVGPDGSTTAVVVLNSSYLIYRYHRVISYRLAFLYNSGEFSVRVPVAPFVDFIEFEPRQLERLIVIPSMAIVSGGVASKRARTSPDENPRERRNRIACAIGTIVFYC